MPGNNDLHSPAAADLHVATRTDDVTQRMWQWALPFLAVFLPIVLLSIYSFRVASGSVWEIVQRENIAAADHLSELLAQEVKRTVTLIRAFTSVPGTVEAVSTDDAIAMTQRLKGMIIAYPQIERAYVTDPRGIIWSSYPEISSLYETDISSAAWYKELFTSRGVAVSPVYTSPVDDQPVIAYASSVEQDGYVIGVVVFEYAVRNVLHMLESVEISSSGHLFMMDNAGRIVAHSTGFVPVLSPAYDDVPFVSEGLKGESNTVEYLDPVHGEMMIATFQPVAVGRRLWLVIAQQERDLAYVELERVKFNISLVGGVLTFFTMLIVIRLARLSSRNVRLNRELKAINQKLREIASIVASSSDAIIGHGTDGTIRSWNKSAERIYGFTAAEMIGQPIRRIVPEDRWEEIRSIQENITSGNNVVSIESERVRRDGTRIPVSLTVSPVCDDDGVVIGASSIDRDITERKEIEKMRNDFISFVSHQLKAPVTAIRWLVEELLEGDCGALSEDVVHILHEIQEANAQNHRLISNILNASRIERGVIAVDCAPMPLCDIVEKSVSNYRLAAEKANLALVIEGCNASIMVMADAEKMAEAVSNSVSNAIKHTPKGGTITVCMRTEGKFGIIDVRDTGEGMPKEMMEKLFKRDQVLGGNASPEKSTGLGLYIAKKFMEMQGGGITVESQVGVGTVFTYSIPLASNIDKK